MKKKEIILFLFLLFMDQIAKFGMEPLLNNGNITIIPNFFSLTWMENTGAAWSLLQERRIFLILVGIVCLGVVTVIQKSIQDSRLKSAATSLLYAGILGNLLDRIIFGYVRDYLHFTFFGYSFPIFNLADVFIVCGAILFIILIFKEEMIDGKNRSTDR